MSIYKKLARTRIKGNKSIEEKMYEVLQSDSYKSNLYKTEDRGEGMAVIYQVIWGWWKPRFVLNHNAKTAFEFMDSNECLVTVTTDDIDFDSLKNLPEDVVDVAQCLSFHFPSFIRWFHNGVAQVAEKEDAEAEVKAAKKEVEAIHQHRDYLVETNRTKEERKKRLDSDIRAKENHSKALDETIKAKSENINELDEKEAEKLRDIYELRSREDWQDSVFLAISAYIYRIDEGFQFCIKAIQDYAFSGFKCRGGHHGDIFWDNESLGIKTFMTLFAELAATSLETVATWFVWLANQMAKFNDWELRRADREVHDIAKGRYDGRIQRYQNHQGLSR